MSEAIASLRRNIASVYLGNSGAVDRVICCLLAGGHVLIEDVPGVGKTVLATALARSVNCSFNRIQLTPDLLPSDILGVTVFNRDSQQFEFKRGPIFANVVLADEINRTPPRTQTALLEAMSEASVTVDGVTHRLERPFMLVATQNPYDFEGTYLLPENQLDRFLMRLTLGYPAPADEARVLTQRPGEEPLHGLKPVITATTVVELQDKVKSVAMDEALVRYIIDLASATRQRDDLLMGLSPRGSLALAQAARAWAIMNGRDYVVPEDILENVVPVASHRVVCKAYSGGARMGSGGAPDAAAVILKKVMETLKVPS